MWITSALCISHRRAHTLLYASLPRRNDNVLPSCLLLPLSTETCVRCGLNSLWNMTQGGCREIINFRGAVCSCVFSPNFLIASHSQRFFTCGLTGLWRLREFAIYSRSRKMLLLLLKRTNLLFLRSNSKKRCLVPIHRGRNYFEGGTRNFFDDAVPKQISACVSA